MKSLLTLIAVTLLGLSTTLLSQTSQNTNPSGNPSNRIESIAFSPDGKLLVTTSTNQAIRIWDVSSGKPIASPAMHLGTWQLVSFKYNDDDKWSEAPKEQRRIRLVTDTHFTWVNYEVAGGKAQTVAGGAYTFNEGKYIESIDFAGEGMTEYLGKKQSFTIRIEGDKWHQSGQLSDGTRIEEVWQRVK